MAVHPRACGGNCDIGRGESAYPGPSPRVRGKLYRAPKFFGRERSIPARAGETAIPSWVAIAVPVHPRACGGNPTTPGRVPPEDGPSPRVRGKLVLIRHRELVFGSIPARAGETRGAPVAPSR